MKNYYKVLELPKNSSGEDIKKSYRRLALIYHPDKNNSDDNKFKELAEAYEVLKNPREKQIYDLRSDNDGNLASNPVSSGGGNRAHFFTTRTQPSAQHFTSSFNGAAFAFPPSSESIFEFLNTLHNPPPHNPSHNSQKRSEKHIEKYIYITYSEVITGVKKTVIVATSTPHTTYEIYINKGTKDGGLIIIPKTDKHYVVHCFVKYKTEDKFTLKDKDLHCYMNVSFKDSILIPTITVTTATLEKIYMKLDKPIKDKSISRLKNHGIPLSQNASERGELIIHFSVIYPLFSELQKKLIHDNF